MKDRITNVVALLFVVVGAVDTYLKSTSGQDINYVNLGFAVLAAIVAYFTGKPNEQK